MKREHWVLIGVCTKQASRLLKLVGNDYVRSVKNPLKKLALHSVFKALKKGLDKLSSQIDDGEIPPLLLTKIPRLGSIGL